MKSLSRSSKETLFIFALLTALLLLFWWRIWTPSLPDRMHFTDDILVKDYATRLGLYHILLSGHLPLWDPYQFGGWPGIANCEAGFFYPFNLLLLPFVNAPQSAYLVTELLVLLHLLIAGMGAYRLARWMGLSVYGSVFASIAFTFCGFHCAHKKHTNMLFALVWFPWILLQIEQWFSFKKQFYLWNATVLLALSYFAGHPQAVLYMSLIFFARFIFQIYLDYKKDQKPSFKQIIHDVLPFFSITVLAFLITSVQWLPTMELIREGARSDADRYASSTEFSLPPYEMIDVVLPETFKQWSQTEVFYWGVAPLLLALSSAAFGVGIPLLRFLIGVGLAAILLSFGNFLFVYDVSYVLIPGVAWVRAPSRWIYFASLPVALCAGYMIDLLKDRHEEAAPFLLRVFTRITGFTLVLTMLAYPASLLLNPSAPQPSFLHNDLTVLLLFLTAVTGALYAYQQQKVSNTVLAVAVTALTWLDLATHYSTFDLAPGTGGYHFNDEVETIREAGWNHRTKIFLNAGGNRTKYHGSAQWIPEVDGQSPLTPRLHLHLREDTALLDPNKPNLALYDLCGIRSVLTDAVNIPAPFEKKTDELFLWNEPSVRAKHQTDFFEVDFDYQRSLLSIQSFPFNQVAITDPQMKDTAVDPLPAYRTPIKKPFLLYSGSANAVKAGALLLLDGKDVFSGLGDEPGYYIAVIEPVEYSLAGTNHFNFMPQTVDEKLAVRKRFLEYIEEVPNGSIVIAAVKDNAANELGIEGIAALQMIGASIDLRLSGYRYAHAVIGVKGAPTGSAFEVLGEKEALVLQTLNDLYTSGTTVAKPKPELFATTELSQHYLKLLNEDLPQKPYTRPDNATGSIEDGYFPVSLLIYSSPKKRVITTEDQAIIKINGEDESLNQPGYNLIEFDPHDNSVVRRANFNLLEDYDPTQANSLKDPPSANLAMQEFVRSVTDGNVVIGAIRDEALDLILPDTMTSLYSLGSKLSFDRTDAEKRKRIAHAFVAVKGATYCIEAFGQDLDAVVFTRYAGGPRLIQEDLPPNVIPDEPIDTVEEIADEKIGLTFVYAGKSGNRWQVEDISPNELRISGTADRDGLLFVNEMLYPGWKAYVDGIEMPIIRANYYFRGVPVMEGDHEVIMKYAPNLFKMGAWISVFGIMLLLFWKARLFLQKPV